MIFHKKLLVQMPCVFALCTIYQIVNSPKEIVAAYQLVFALHFLQLATQQLVFCILI